MGVYEDRRARKQASRFEEHATYERLRTLPPAERDALLERLGPTYRTGYGYYLSARDAAQRLEKESTR